MLPILSNLLAEAQGGRINFTATALERGIHCSPSSLLMLILLLWSVPILIYAVLFFPELTQFMRGRGGVHLRHERDSGGSELPFDYLMPTIRRQR
jgi:hypothetical protein